jgi:hypothetical protein
MVGGGMAGRRKGCERSRSKEKALRDYRINGSHQSSILGPVSRRDIGQDESLALLAGIRKSPRRISDPITKGEFAGNRLSAKLEGTKFAHFIF